MLAPCSTGDMGGEYGSGSRIVTLGLVLALGAALLLPPAAPLAAVLAAKGKEEELVSVSKANPKPSKLCDLEKVSQK